MKNTILKNRLLNNNSGAIMVLGLFAGLFLVAVLYHIMGVGNAVSENELMQDAADSITLSAATVKARGMNTIAMINLIMALALSVLVAIRLVQLMIGIAIAAVGVACAFSFGAACTAAAPLIGVEKNLKTIHEKIEPAIKEIMQALEKGSDVVAKGVPFIAEAEAVYISRKESKDVSQIGFVWPVVDKLPVEPGDFSDLCDQAGHQVVQVSSFFLPGNLPKKADETVGELLGGMAGKFSKFFCGDGGKPSVDKKVKTAYPIKENGECDAGSAKIDSKTHKCKTDLCSRCTDDACTICTSKFNEEGYSMARWNIVEEKWEETTDRSGIVTKTDKKVKKYFKWLADDPCNGEAKCGEEAICETSKSDTVFKSEEDNNITSKVIVTRKVYKAIESCIVKEKSEPGEMPEALNSSDWPVHKVIKKDAKEKDFNIIGVAAGKNSGDARLKNVGIPIGKSKNQLLDKRIAVAKSQFLSPNNDLWHMDWYSRLIRFKMDKDEKKSTGCSGTSNAACSKVTGNLGKIKKLGSDLIIH
ncbi:MAG: hypothetical protein JXR91_00200 [Deltaproteobacteria bacterium]|nr:hypothetical protein [Deltaproteobacteria bacterium]